MTNKEALSRAARYGRRYYATSGPIERADRLRTEAAAQAVSDWEKAEYNLDDPVYAVNRHNGIISAVVSESGHLYGIGGLVGLHVSNL